MPSWSPGARDFPLTVTLDPRMSTDAETQAQIKVLVGKAIDGDPARGDSVAFGPVNPTPTASLMQSPRAIPFPQPGPAAEKADSASSNLIIWTTLATALLVVALLWVRQRPQSLSDAQRADLIARLKTVLDSENTNAAEA